MRGFFGAAMVLVVLDLILRSPESGVAQALALPTKWLVAWTDATKPLINRPVPGKVSGSSAGNPANTPQAVAGANRLNNAPPQTPANPGIPPEGPHVIYPPGSQNVK